MARSHGGRSSGGSRSSSRGSSFSGRSRSHLSFGSSSRRASHNRSHSPTRPLHHSGGIHIHTSYHTHSPSHTGRYSIPMSKKTSSILTCIIIMAFIAMFILASFMTISSHNSSLDAIETSFLAYKDMIAFAETNPSYSREAEIVAKKYDIEYKMWYLEYIVYDDETGMFAELEQSTFAIYTKDEINNFHIGDTITVALDSPSPSSASDSINMDYKDEKLEDDNEYKTIKRNINICRIILVVLIIAEGLLVFAIIKFARKKTTNEEKSTTQTTLVDNTQYCEYCGSKLADDTSKCSLCGASNTKKQS